MCEGESCVFSCCRPPLTVTLNSEAARLLRSSRRPICRSTFCRSLALPVAACSASLTSLVSSLFDEAVQDGVLFLLSSVDRHRTKVSSVPSGERQSLTSTPGCTSSQFCSKKLLLELLQHGFGSADQIACTGCAHELKVVLAHHAAVHDPVKLPPFFGQVVTPRLW